MRLAFLTLAFAATLLATPQPAPCQANHCAGYVCVNSSGCPGHQCACVLNPGSGFGRCGWVR